MLRSSLILLKRITTTINIARFACSLVPTLSPTFQVILANPAVLLTGAMACRVHRNLVIEALNDSDGKDGSLTAPKFAGGRVVSDVTLPTSTGRSVLPQSGPKVSVAGPQSFGYVVIL